MHTRFALSLAAATLFVAPSSFAGSLSLGPEIDLSPPTFSGNGESQYPRVATDGTDYLVVWQDHITGAAFGARVTAAGVVLDQPAVTLALTGAPAVFWDGAQYLVLAGTQGQTINPATGASSAAFSLAGLSGTPALAFGGSGILAVMTSSSAPLQATLFDETGAVIHPAVTLSQSSESTGLAPAVTYGGGEFLVAWSDEVGEGPAVARVSSAGALVDTSPVLLSGGSDGGIGSFSASELNVAGSPNGFLVSWYDGRDSGIYAARVTTAGAVSDPGGFAVVSSTWSKAPAGVAWAGTYWWLSAFGSNQLDQYVETVSTAGAVTSSVFYNFGSGPPQAAAAADGSLLTVVPTEGFTIDGQITSPGGAQGNGFLVSAYLTAQTQVAVATSGRGYIASWYENSVYMAVRFGADGTPIDTTPLSLVGPIWGSTANGYLVFGGGREYGMLFLPDGIAGPSAATKVLIAPFAANYSAMICNATACVGAIPPNGSPWDETILPLGADAGAYTVTPFPTTTSCTGNQYAIGTNGSDFLFMCAGGVAPIAANGTAGMGVDGGLAGLTGADPETLAWGTHDYLLLSDDEKTAYRVDANGTYVSGPQALPFASLPSWGYATWDGRAFLIVGETETASGSIPDMIELAEDVVDGGAPLAATPLFAAAGTPSVASLRSGGALAVADQPRGAFNTTRAIGRWITLTDDDAGTDGGGAGGPDAAADGSAEAGGGGGSDDGGLDAGAPSDAGVPSDAGLDAGAQRDATSGVGASADTGTGTSASLDGSADAGLEADGGGNGDGGDSTSSGCGCTVAGSEGAGTADGMLTFAAAAFLAIGRRRRSRAE